MDSVRILDPHPVIDLSRVENQKATCQIDQTASYLCGASWVKSL